VYKQTDPSFMLVELQNTSTWKDEYLKPTSESYFMLPAVITVIIIS